MTANYEELARGCAAIARTAGQAIMRSLRRRIRGRAQGRQLAADRGRSRRASHDPRWLGMCWRRRFRCCRRNPPTRFAWSERRTWSRYLLVDPLDGTREFVKRNGEFTVNIALIEHGKPVARRGVRARARRDVLRVARRSRPRARLHKSTTFPCARAGAPLRSSSPAAVRMPIRACWPRWTSSARTNWSRWVRRSSSVAPRRGVRICTSATD